MRRSDQEPTLIKRLREFLLRRKSARTLKANFNFGEAWEDAVREHFFVSGFYELLEKTHDYKQNRNDFVRASLNPDYKFHCTYTHKDFYVECKARDITKLLKKAVVYLDQYERLTRSDENKALELKEANKYLQLLDLCSKDQFARFKELNTRTKVLFMVLLTSDHSIRDDIVTLVPMDDLLSHQVFYSQLLQYQIADSEIEPRSLWRNFLLFYGHPAFCIRCQKKIKFNNLNPFCYECWRDWYEYHHFMDAEKYCHACGKDHRTTSIKPLCVDCFRSFPINYAL